ncbi:MAG: glycosyltransferase family 2 protein [Candidatus Omnitrophica bacterium]|nr:glycosyltransferase family 2 protein [Candidatus Omnitrophota bacterium]
MTENNKNNISNLVSIIVPVYNSEQYIVRCLESVIHQTHKNIELLITDDGSTDNSGKICDTYAFNDNRIRVVHTQNNGISAARNIGVDKSRGEFIFFLDSDDIMENNAIELLIENFNRTKADIIIGNFKSVKGDIVEERRDVVFSRSNLLDKQEIINYSRCYLKKPNKNLLFAYPWGKLFKSSIIKENNISFDINLHNFEDVTFIFDYLKYVKNAYFLKEIVYGHQIYDSFVSATMAIGNNLKKLFDFRPALVKIGDFLSSYISVSDIQREIGHADVYFTIIQLVRICGQINANNRKLIFKFIQEVVNNSNFRKQLRFYSPSKGDSRIIPILIKLKFIRLIILICRYKAYKRYKS